jgi:carbonic anhydrase
VVVVLVAVPLSLGIAMASGAPLAAGLVAAGVGGVVASLLGGTPLQVSGPAAGLTFVLAELVSRHGWAVTCAITAAAGLIQIGLGLLRVARVALAIPPAVVHGMVAGIGVIIVSAQLHVVLGGAPSGSALDNVLRLPGRVVDHAPAEVALGLLTMALLVAWPRMPRPLRAVPGPLAAVGLSALVATALRADVTYVDLPRDVLRAPGLTGLPSGPWLDVGLAALTLALVASVESLLSATAVDRMTSGPRAHLDRELVGQGAANLASGLLGGMPVTGVIVRSAANVQAGARSRASALLHGVWILLLAGLAGGVLASLAGHIPLSVLGALLVTVGVRMVTGTQFRRVHAHGELVGYLVTVAGVVLLGLMEGVALGVAAAVALSLHRLSHLHVAVRTAGESHHVRITGRLTFLRVPRLTRDLATLPAGSPVEVEVAVDHLDHAGREALESWRVRHQHSGGTVRLHLRSPAALERGAVG